MYIQKVIVKNYRCLKEATVALNPELNVIVGNNECGKSTLLEAINLALTGQLNGRSLQTELHPYLFNSTVVFRYIEDLKKGITAPPPGFEIELYFADDAFLAELKGTNNSLKEDLPGIVISAEFNKDYQAEFEKYVEDPELIKTLPIEYYLVRWRNFADGDITIRSVPLKCAFIDASTICSGLMYPDTDLGENARHGEVFDEQAETYVFPGVQTAGSMSGVGSRI